MGEPKTTNDDKRQRRTLQLTIALLVLVTVIYVVTFAKLPDWLPALT